MFVIFLSLSAIKSFRDMGVGGQGPQDIEIWHFPIKCFAKKVVFFVSSGENKILPLLAPLQIYFWPPLDITVHAGKFLSMRRIFAQSLPTCPKSFVWLLLTNFLPWRTLFGVTSRKRVSVFFANVAHHFLKSNNVGCHFCLDCLGFCPDFNKSKHLGCTFPLHPHPLYPCRWKIHYWLLSEKILPVPMFRGTCSPTEILKGYMARGSLGTPALRTWTCFHPDFDLIHIYFVSELLNRDYPDLWKIDLGELRCSNFEDRCIRSWSVNRLSPRLISPPA